MVCLLAACTGTSPLAAQNPPIKIAGWTVSGSLRLRFEGWQWFDTAAADSSYGFGASLLRVGVARQTPRADWQFEVSQPVLIGLPSKSVAAAPQGQLGLGATYFASNPGQDGGVFLKQGFVRVKGIAGDRTSSLRVGRFLFTEGQETSPEDATMAALKRDRVSHRLFSTFDFTHSGRAYDGIHFVKNTPRLNLTAVAARPTEGVFQVRGMKELNVNVFYGAGTTTLGKARKSEARLFAIHYRDGRNTVKTDNRPLAVRTADREDVQMTTAGGHILAVSAAGTGLWDFLLWGAAQTGGWGQLNHRAAAIAVEAGYQATALPGKPWWRSGYFASSGDDDPGDNTHNTFFQVLPTPRVYARFPFYNLMNNRDTFGQLSLRLHPKVNVASEFHYLSLSSPRDLWYAGGGAFESRTFGFLGRPSDGNTKLATVADLDFLYRPNPQTTVQLYVAGAGRQPRPVDLSKRTDRPLHPYRSPAPVLTVPLEPR